MARVYSSENYPAGRGQTGGRQGLVLKDRRWNLVPRQSWASLKQEGAEGVGQGPEGSGGSPWIFCLLFMSLSNRKQGHQGSESGDSVDSLGIQEKGQNGNLGEGRVTAPGKDAWVPFAARFMPDTM